MKVFVFKVLFFLVVLTIIVFSLSYLGKSRANEMDYLAAMLDKHKRLDSIPVNKIILAGGSNVAFGFDSEKLQNHFSVPVVNLGLHAGLGLSFILQELKHSIKEGDVVLLSLEYFMNTKGVYKIKKQAANYYKPARNYYPFEIRGELETMLDNLKQNILNLFNRAGKINERKAYKNKVYIRKGFNLYGDEVGHLNLIAPQKIKIGRNYMEYKLWPGIKLLNKFNEFAKDKHVRVYFLFPDLAFSEFSKNRLAIQKFYMDVKNQLQVETLNTPYDFIYPNNLFFDTKYHLNKIGRDIRTVKLIDLIEKNDTLIEFLVRSRHRY